MIVNSVNFLEESPGIFVKVIQYEKIVLSSCFGLVAS